MWNSNRGWICLGVYMYACACTYVYMYVYFVCNRISVAKTQLLWIRNRRIKFWMRHYTRRLWQLDFCIWKEKNELRSNNFVSILNNSKPVCYFIQNFPDEPHLQLKDLKIAIYTRLILYLCVPSPVCAFNGFKGVIYDILKLKLWNSEPKKCWRFKFRDLMDVIYDNVS